MSIICCLMITDLDLMLSSQYLIVSESSKIGVL
nr:MAG TPA: protein of unknown function (DUF5463) [Bacteriophage sp.]